MKKILSTLVMCLILGVGALYSQGTVTVWAYANVNTKSQNNLGGGTVQAHATSRDGWSNSTWYSGTIGSSSSIVGREAKGGLIGAVKYKVSYSADAYPNDGYYFSHWLNEKGETLTGKGDTKNGIQDIEHAWVGSGNKDVRVFAIFKPVTVDAMTIDGEAISAKTLNSTDKNGYKEATIVFTTAHADNWNDFKNDAVVLEGDSRFTIQSSNRNGNTVTVVVRFTDDNRHVLEGTLPSATVTLTSKGDATSKKTATITATSDLTPKTTITPSPCDLTRSSPVLAGNTVSQEFTVAAAVGYTNVFAQATIKEVKFSNPDDAAQKGYTLDANNPKEPIVSFTPTVFSINQANVETEICVTTAYTDKSGKKITHTECVTITADAGKIITIGGEDDAVMDFGIIDYTATNVPVSIEYPIYSTLAATAFTKMESDFTTDISYVVNKFTGSGATDDKLTVTVNSTMYPNDYTATLKYTENGADPISALLTVKVSIKLAKPVVTATVPDGNVTLTWPAVYGANRYIIKSEGVEIATVTATTYKVTNIGGQELTLGRQYPFTVTAVYDANPEKGNRESDIVYATPGIPTVITYGDINDINMYTGTEMGAGDGGVYESFPYSKKRKIQLNRIFDETGNPLFEELYIFGVTTEIDGTHDNINLPSTKLGCNATTPLYVYELDKVNKKYVKTAEYDAVKKRFDQGASKNGQHLYFTGYCPFAYMGVNATEEGWMYFKDDGNEKKRTVDIYLDNCEIMGRYKTPTGKNANYNEYTLELTADIGTIGGTEPNNSFIFGASSPFIFTSARTSSSEPYQPTIHIAGKNHLQGQLGSYITKTVGIVDLSITSATIDAGIKDVFTYSAPITIKPLDLSTFTDLVMTDIWKDNTITNGYLKLDATKPTNSNAEKVVAIDLGSKNGSLTINGGQYHLRNSAADGTYACNLAIGYRRFSKLVERDVPFFGAMKVLLHLYGFGGDVADCKVIINSGTFTMYKNMYMSGSTPLGSEYYKDLENFLDLRLPAGEGKSQINGGTFNGISNVLMCSRVITTGASPENARGNWLCLHDVTIPVENQQPNGTATFDIPDPFHKGYGSDPKAVCYNMTNGDLVVKGQEYGAQSLNFYEKDIDGDSENEKVVSLLLPGQACRDDCVDCEYQKEAIIFQWATAIPRFQVKKTVNGKELDVNVGGSINVEETPLGEDMEYKTTQLLYMDCAGMENYSMNLAAQGATLTFDDPNLPRGQVGNENDYEILRHLNILKSVQADTWYTFTAPFDVHDISVIETSENTIKNKTRTEALELQAQGNLQLLYGWQDVLIPNEEGRASSFTLEALLGARRKTLVHYDGTNIMAANYYLYELENEEFSTPGIGENLAITWKPVKRNNAGEPLMYKGKTYAIQFPWCPMCNDLYVDDPEKKRKYYDYWSNKLILFHGKGPQTVLGTTGQSSLSTAPDIGFATLAGNSTFANMTLAANTAYVHNVTNDYFELNNEQYVVKPTEGFMLYNPGGSKMPARISRSGKIEYDENVETGVDGVPTISDRTSLMLFGAYDGFEILSLCEQLVTVYNLQGNIVFQQYMAEGEQVYVGTGAGIFVVRGERETIKVMVE